jgi:hypothetical protein
MIRRELYQLDMKNEVVKLKNTHLLFLPFKRGKNAERTIVTKTKITMYQT